MVCDGVLWCLVAREAWQIPPADFSTQSQRFVDAANISEVASSGPSLEAVAGRPGTRHTPWHVAGGLGGGVVWLRGGAEKSAMPKAKVRVRTTQKSYNKKLGSMKP